jgi:hypothetical protein
MTKYKFYKDGSLERPKNISKEEFISASYGDEFDLRLTDSRISRYYFTGTIGYNNEDYKKIKSLKNTINYYSGLHNLYNFNNFLNKPVCFLGINSQYLGSGINRGSVRLAVYVSGTLVDYVEDFKENGILSSSKHGEIGVVLYREGIFLLTNTSSLSTEDFFIEGETQKVKWSNFLGTSNSSYLNYETQFSCNENVESNSFLITINKNELNHSNNSTYLQSGSYSYTTGSNIFLENYNLTIKNIVESPFVSGTANFEKETYITKIGLYDNDKKLLAVASLANPLRKTENREFLIKLKLDI